MEQCEADIYYVVKTRSVGISGTVFPPISYRCTRKAVIGKLCMQHHAKYERETAHMAGQALIRALHEKGEIG